MAKRTRDIKELVQAVFEHELKEAFHDGFCFGRGAYVLKRETGPFYKQWLKEQREQDTPES